MVFYLTRNHAWDNFSSSCWNIREAKLLQPVTTFVESRDVLTQFWRIKIGELYNIKEQPNSKQNIDVTMTQTHLTDS